MARILVVEDEMLVAMMVEDMVADLGHLVVASAMRLETALAAAGQEDIDLAILDINLAGKQSFPVADRLRERGIAFIFASGYGAAGLIDAYRGAPVLQKPFEMAQLGDVIDQLLSDAGDGRGAAHQRVEPMLRRDPADAGNMVSPVIDG
ncbi:response regulator [Rhizobium sp.]